MPRLRLIFSFLLAFISATIISNGRQLKEDSPSYTTDTAAINALLRETHKILNPDSAIVAYDSIFRLSSSIGYADGAFAALITMGIKYFEKQDYENYRRMSYAAIPWAQKSQAPDAEAWCLINIGEAWFSEGDYTTANEFYYKGLKSLNSNTKEITHTTANIYNSLGLVNLRLNQHDKAIFFFRKAYNMSVAANLQYQIGIACDNIGRYFILMQQPDSAMKYFNQEMQTGKDMGKVDLVAFANANIGKVYLLQHKYESAIASLNTAISLAQNRFYPSVVDAAFSLSDALMHTGNLKEAGEMLRWAYAETRAHNYRDYYIVAYRQLSDLHKTMGEYDISLKYMDSLVMIKDTLTNANKARAINNLEIKYKSYEKDLKIAENELLIEKQKNALSRKNLLVWAIGSVIVLLIGLFFLRFRNTRNKNRLQAEQIKSLQQENTIGILNAKVEGEEKERGRIARELHDGIGGMLSAAMMRLSTLPRQATAAADAPAYKEAMGLLGEMGDEIRKTSHNLMPESLLKQDLSDALNTLCGTLQADGKLKITYQCYGDYSRLSQDVKLNVYRIIQELLKNIVQHAHATKVLVQTVLHDHNMNITVEDNGTGFETDKNKLGIGLYNIDARVHSLNGICEFESAPDKGTTVNIELDLSGST